MAYLNTNHFKTRKRLLANSAILIAAVTATIRLAQVSLLGGRDFYKLLCNSTLE